MVKDRTFVSVAFDVINHVLLALVTLACLLPIIHIIAVSFSDRAATSAGVVTFLPVNLNTVNYQRVFGDAQFLRSARVSALRVLLGTSLQVFMVTITAYPLSLSKGFRGQTAFKWLLIFCMMFSGGLIPWYLVLRMLHLSNNIWGLVLPGALSLWEVIIMVNFFRDMPPEISEAAEIDGASHWDILFRIYVPLSLPAIAMVTLFSAVGHWNSWFDGLVLMNDTRDYPLQSYLQTMIVSRDYLRLLKDAKTIAMLSERSLRGAQIVIATIPIVVIYPLLQRYFVSGLRLGSVKG